MTTLKLNKKPDGSQTKATKPPVRRLSNTARDRSVPPAKLKSSGTDDRDAIQAPAKPSQGNLPRQRNHRYDGTLHESAPVKSQAPDRHTPTTSTVPADVRSNAQASRDRADREGAYRNPPRRGGKMRDGFVASEFDKTRTNKAAFAKKQANGEPDLPRLSKVMADRGLCSRREADAWIANGWVKVDGEVVETLGTRIRPEAEIIISSYAKEYQAENVTIILHKPVGYVSGQAEDGYAPAIVLVHPDNQWEDDPELHRHHPKQFHRGMLKGLAPAGRLDIDSTGMLVLTQDGRIARHLIGEDSTVEKEYLVRVTGELSDADLKRLNFGLSLDGEKLKPAKVSWQNKDQLRFVLREGKKRQIRRMCEMVGLHVVGLKRIRIGSVNLGKLPVGQWRYLRSEERF